MASQHGMWDLVSWPRIKPALPTLEAWSLNPWTIKAGKPYYYYSYLEQREIYCRAQTFVSETSEHLPCVSGGGSVHLLAVAVGWGETSRIQVDHLRPTHVVSCPPRLLRVTPTHVAVPLCSCPSLGSRSHHVLGGSCSLLHDRIQAVGPRPCSPAEPRVVAKWEWATPVTLVCSSQELCVLPLGTQNRIETSDLIKTRRLDSTLPLRALPQLAFRLCL